MKRVTLICGYELAQKVVLSALISSTYDPTATVQYFEELA